MKGMDRLIRLLIVANFVVVACLLAAVVVFSLQRSPAGHPEQALASPTPSGSPELMSMGLAHIPTSNSCLLCHETGGSAGLKVVPAVGHPIEGWGRCTVCHTGDRLGQDAPGHEGIPEAECLNCHKAPPEGPSITQPHSRFQDQQCLDCHGTYAHLPSSMVGRDEDECWLCHKPTASPPPEYPHPATIPQGCRSCHVAEEAGNLPIDHALRDDSTCLLCHDIKTAGSPPASLPATSPAASPAASPNP
jgi:hypothetical protein